MVLSLHTFPTVDLRDARSSDFSHRVMDALRSQGFLAVKGHRATRELMDEAERLTAELFTRWTPDELESWFGRPDLFRQRGVTGILIERAAAQPGQERPPADLKQFFMIRDEDVPRNLANMPYGPNIWPNDILPRFRIVMLELMVAFKEIYFTLLEAVERACGLRHGKLTGMAKGAETVLRPIFYPGYDRLRAMGIEIPSGAQRSAPHGDINALTVLRPRPGLWALLNGQWVKADASDPEVIWVNIGEMIAQVEGVEGLVPTIHCVGTPPGMSDPAGDALLLQDRVAFRCSGTSAGVRVCVEVITGIRCRDGGSRPCGSVTGSTSASVRSPRDRGEKLLRVASFWGAFLGPKGLGGAPRCCSWQCFFFLACL